MIKTIFVELFEKTPRGIGYPIQAQIQSHFVMYTVVDTY